MMTLEQIDKINALIDECAEGKKHIEECQKYLNAKEEQLLALISSHQKEEGFEGVEHYTGRRGYDIRMEHKVTRKVCQEDADIFLRKLGLEPKQAFLVKYDFSKRLWDKLPEEDRELLSSAVTAKPAKTYIKITKEEENGKTV